MNTGAAIATVVVGVLAFCGAIYALIKAQVRQQSATEDNTRAMRDLTRKFENLTDKVDGHDRDLQSLKDWRTSIGFNPRWPR